MKILLLDNYDSFTYNLLHYLESNDGVEVEVVLNDKIDTHTISLYDAIVLSPGPGLPQDAGSLLEVIKQALLFDKPILGVCLGMQALAIHFGMELYNQSSVKHGVAERCLVQGNSLFYHQIPLQFSVGLYHSWAVKPNQENEFVYTAFSENMVLMSMEHKIKPIVGVQFHPESVLTEYGKQMIENFVILAKFRALA